MPPLDPRLRSTPIGQVPDQLPLLTGLNPAEIQSGKRIESLQGLAALRLIQTFSESSMAAMTDIKRVDVGSPEVLVVTTGRGSEVTFGLQDFDRQLLRWREIQDRGMRYNKAIAFLDLAVTNNTPARFVDASQQPNTPPQKRITKPSKTSSTTRRRNV